MNESAFLLLQNLSIRLQPKYERVSDAGAVSTSSMPSSDLLSSFTNACNPGQETLDRFAAKKARSKNPEKTPAQTNPGAWAPEVSVQRVVWNNGNGLGKCQLLASGTASGLCRIDWVKGRWFKDQTPGAGGIETLRGEVDGDGDVDMDEAEAEGDGEVSD